MNLTAEVKKLARGLNPLSADERRMFERSVRVRFSPRCPALSASKVVWVAYRRRMRALGWIGY